MKITVRKLQEKKKEINWEDLDIGTVFEYEHGVTGLRIEGGVLLLNYFNGDSWLDNANGYLAEPIKKVLGTIDEVIVI